MNRNGSAPIIAALVILALVVLGGAAYVLLKQNASPQAEPTIDTSKRQTYSNGRYGISFKYPASFTVKEYNSDLIALLPTGFEGNNVESGYIDSDGLNATQHILKIESVCEYSPDRVTKEFWADNSHWDYSGDPDPLEELAQGFVGSYPIGMRTLHVFTQDCFECYGAYGNPDADDDGFAAFSCTSGLNKNGNKAVHCVTLATERRKIGSPELEALKRFFLDELIPTITLEKGSNILECEGVGETKG